MVCPHCTSTSVVKNGFKADSKKQRYKCRSCRRKFVCGGQDWFVSDRERLIIDNLLKERTALRGICRVVGISLSWLVAYTSSLYQKQPQDLGYIHKNRHKGSNGEVVLTLYECEADEMWSFVGKKTNKQWIWIALCGRTKQVICFHVGGRGREDAKLFWAKIPEEVKQQSIIHTDDWEPYKGVIPEAIHRPAKMKKFTNHIERFNNTVRQRVSRLVRKTLSFSKKLENHILALRYFFCAYNKETQAKMQV